MTLPPRHDYYCTQFGMSGLCPVCHPMPTCKNCGHTPSEHRFTDERVTFGSCPGCLGCMRHVNPFVAEGRTRFMSYTEENEHLVFVPEESLDFSRPGQFTAMVMQWWAVDPQRGLIVWKRPGISDAFYPQTNVDQGVAEKLTHDLYPWAEAKQIPLVLISHSGMPLTKENG